ncbi:hypothetical protein Daus18300_010004 [Diaporthe australafricana]|uniref:Proteophosphoglycan ppg4 n=1 Tax=Diaporthe australafricana TaxID=127596 RepID=A0ABR3WC01_9PEZI
MTAPQQGRPPRSTQVILKQSKFPAFLAVFYLALLIVPWALTCTISRRPSFIVQLYRWDTRYYVQRGWLIAINVLNSLAIVLALPILSALLARAAVVFSQRRKPGQTLSARQLFALADRGWYSWAKVKSSWSTSALLRFGFGLLFMAIALPVVRSALVAYDKLRVLANTPARYDGFHSVVLGSNPSPIVLKTSFSGQPTVIKETRKNLQTTTGGVEVNLWPVCNDNTTTKGTCGFKYGPYDMQQSLLSNFWEEDLYYTNWKYETNGSALMHASTMKAGSSTGSYQDNDLGDYTLGLKTGAKCEAVSVEEVEAQCLRSTGTEDLHPAALGWSTHLEVPGEVSLDICLPALEGNPWEAADASPWKPFNFTEHIYFNLKDNSTYNSWGCSSSSPDCGYIGSWDGLHIHCQADTTMSYFEIGSDRTNGKPTRFLEEMPAGFDVPRDDSFYSDRDYDYDMYGEYMGYEGPLKTATMAMFGNDSWLGSLSLAFDADTANETAAAALTMVCQMRPLGNRGDIFSLGAIDCDWSEYQSYFGYSDRRSYLFGNAVREFFGAFNSPRLGRAMLNTATFFANNALLSQMSSGSAYNVNDYKYSTGETDEWMLVPVLSLGVIIAVSILILLQVVGVVLLLIYIYSSPVWTKTLDAMAMARVGAQLSALDAFLVPRETGTLGPAVLTRRASKQLDNIDAMIGSIASPGGHHDVEMATLPPPYAPRGEEPVTREEQRAQHGAASRATSAPENPAPSYSPPADEHTTRTGEEEAGAAVGRGDAVQPETSHAVPPERQDAPLPPLPAPSLEALAVGGQGLITKRMWKEAGKAQGTQAAQQ